MKAPSTPNKRPLRPHAVQTHEVRIIGGHWKRSKLKVADKPGLRPTPDRVRETLFNWLGQDLSGQRCVDAFAGTGALGFEAASRGAATVQLVERDPDLVEQLQRTRAQLLALRLPASATPVVQLQVQRGEGLSALRQLAPQSQDLIFLDPPFDADCYEAALQASVRALAPGGAIYLESPRLWGEEVLQPLGLVVWRHLKAGAVHAHLLHQLS